MRMENCRPLRGQASPPRKLQESKVFCATFFKKVAPCLTPTTERVLTRHGVLLSGGYLLTESLKVERCAGAALAAALPALAALRIRVFRDWPYLYDGTDAYEAAYLQTYLKAPGAAVMVAWDGEQPVGASTCLPMAEADAAVQAPFRARGLDLGAFFYFGESVLLPAYRGRGIGVRFFELREAQASAHPGVRHAGFCAVQRPPDHKLRPSGAGDLSGFWTHRGYTRRPDLTCRMAWKDIDQPDETEKTLVFWLRALHGDPLP